MARLEPSAGMAGGTRPRYATAAANDNAAAIRTKRRLHIALQANWR